MVKVEREKWTGVDSVCCWMVEACGGLAANGAGCKNPHRLAGTRYLFGTSAVLVLVLVYDYADQ